VTSKEKLHDVIEALSEDETRDALRYLGVWRIDPALAVFRAAPIDVEPVTEEQERGLDEAREDRRLEEIRDEFA
jgi:hypothetical protein